MNILMATTEYPPAVLGGSAESVRLTAEALGARGHRVGVVTPQWSHAPGEDREVVNGVAIERFTDRRGARWRWGSEREVSGIGFWLGASSVILEVATAGRGADVIHAQDRRMLVPVFRAARRARRPSVLTLRDVGLRCPIVSCLVIERPGGEIPDDCGARRLWTTCGPLYRGRYGLADPYTEEPRAFGPRAKLVARYAILAYERKIARRFTRIAYVSRGLAAHYARAFPGEPSILYSPVTSVATHRCIAAPPFALPPAGAPIVLFVGKPSPGKGFPDFEDAGALVTNYGRNVVRFVHVGPLPARPNPWIESVGPLRPDEVEAWRCRSSVCVVPSRQADALPRTALEAMAHGVPTVGTKVGGIPEALGGYGWLVPAGNPKRLAQAIRGALAHPPDEKLREERRRMTQERFGPEATAAAHERLYAGVGG